MKRSLRIFFQDRFSVPISAATRIFEKNPALSLFCPYGNYNFMGKKSEKSDEAVFLEKVFQRTYVRTDFYGQTLLLWTLPVPVSGVNKNFREKSDVAFGTYLSIWSWKSPIIQPKIASFDPSPCHPNKIFSRDIALN